MSKKITHEQARQHLVNKIKDGDILTVLEYIKQQEELEQHQKHSFVNELSGILYDLKQTEKLLELYKKLNNIYEKFYTMELSELALNSNYYEIEIVKLKQQVKELENEKDDI